jgi:hypothetical protein
MLMPLLCRLFPDTDFTEVTFGAEVKGGVQMNLITPQERDEDGDPLQGNEGHDVPKTEAQELDDWLKHGELRTHWHVLFCIVFRRANALSSGVNEAIQKKYLRALLFSIHGHDDASELAEEREGGPQEDDLVEIVSSTR